MDIRYSLLMKYPHAIIITSSVFLMLSSLVTLIQTNIIKASDSLMSQWVVLNLA